MPVFHAFVEGLDELKDELSSDRLSRNVIIGLAKGVNEVHKTLQNEVFKRYGFRHFLASVRLGGSNDTRYLPGAISTIKQDLLYVGERIPLSDFNHTSIFDIEKRSYFHADPAVPDGKIIPRKKPLERVQVTVLRNEGMKNITKGGVRAFTIDGNIVTRKETRRKNPTQLLRSPSYDRMNIRTLYGPSLPEAASWVYENNPIVQEKVNEISNLILEELTKP